MKTLVASTLLAATTAASALELKGLKVGQPVDCPIIKAMETRSGTFYNGCVNGVPSFATEVQFLNVKTLMMVGQSPERVLTFVSMSGIDFETALDALTLKFGAPKLERSVIQNRMGASFDQVEATWTDGDERMVLSKHGGSIGRTSLIYLGKEAVAEGQRVRAEKAKAAASSL